LYGFDNNEFACKLVKEKGFEVWSGDFQYADLPKECFDIINLSHVIEHFNDPKRALIKIHSLLKKNGKLIIIAPNYDSVAAKIFGKYWYALDLPRHLFQFSPKTITRLLSETGFVVKKINCDSDVRIGIKSFNYLFNRKDRRVNFFVWHLFWLIFKPIGNILARFNKTSIMTVEVEKI
jgi:SAM-dependent methyltransferase